MRTRLWCVALALSCGSVPVGAQTVLSEADALARLSLESPRVRAIRARSVVAEPTCWRPGRWPNPRVTFDRESVAGVTEASRWSRSRCRSPDAAASRRARPRRWSTRRPAARTTRSGARARICGSPSRILSPRRRASASWRASRDRLQGARGRARQARGGRRRRGIRSPSGRTRGARSRSRSRRRRHRARPRAGDAGGFFAGPIDPSSLVAARRSRGARDSLPSVEALDRAGRDDPGRIAGASPGNRFRRVRGARRRAARHSRTRNRRRHQVVHRFGRRRRQCVRRAGRHSAVRPRQPGAGAGAARASQAEARIEAFRLRAARGDCRAAGRRDRTRATADRYRAAAASSADRSSASRKSATTRASAAFSSCSMPIGPRPSRVRQACSTRRCAEAEIELEFVSGWEIPYDSATHRHRPRCRPRAWRLAVHSPGRAAGGRAADAGRDELDGEDRALHGVSAARRRRRPRASPCT